MRITQRELFEKNMLLIEILKTDPFHNHFNSFTFIQKLSISLEHFLIEN